MSEPNKTEYRITYKKRDKEVSFTVESLQIALVSIENIRANYPGVEVHLTVSDAPKPPAPMPVEEQWETFTMEYWLEDGLKREITYRARSHEEARKILKAMTDGNVYWGGQKLGKGRDRRKEPR